jgi:endonuclease/exonuclease/phosphatase family metal-dependent hydrolase
MPAAVATLGPERALSPAEIASMQLQLRVLTLNVFAGSSGRGKAGAELAAQLRQVAALDCDIIALQEAWEPRIIDAYAQHFAATHTLVRGGAQPELGRRLLVLCSCLTCAAMQAAHFWWATDLYMQGGRDLWYVLTGGAIEAGPIVLRSGAASDPGSTSLWYVPILFWLAAGVFGILLPWQWPNKWGLYAVLRALLVAFDMHLVLAWLEGDSLGLCFLLRCTVSNVLHDRTIDWSITFDTVAGAGFARQAHQRSAAGALEWLAMERGLLGCTLRTAFGPLRLLNAHMNCGVVNAGRIHQAREVHARARGSDTPTILCMDANSDGKQPEMRWLRENGWEDAWLSKEPPAVRSRSACPGATWAYRNPLTRCGHLVEPDQRCDFARAPPRRSAPLNSCSGRVNLPSAENPRSRRVFPFCVFV